MTKSTREENVQAVFDLKAGYTLGLADVEILKRVARMALAAIDSKPVLSVQFKNGWPVNGTTGVISGSPSLSDGCHDFYAAVHPAPVTEWTEGSEPPAFGKYYVRYMSNTGALFCIAEWLEYDCCVPNRNMVMMWLADHSRSMNALKGVTHFTRLPEWSEPQPATDNTTQPAPVVPDDVQRDAKRWRALLGSSRIRILGSAGFDATAHPGENPDYRHFGMEIWTHYPNWLHEKNEYGIDTLTQYADAMLAAATQEVKK